jgi:hypothetical protein
VNKRDNFFLAILNFVGGKNILVPREKANVSEAKNMCESKGLELMSLSSLTEMDAVQDFLGEIGLNVDFTQWLLSNYLNRSLV